MPVSHVVIVCPCASMSDRDPLEVFLTSNQTELPRRPRDLTSSVFCLKDTLVGFCLDGDWEGCRIHGQQFEFDTSPVDREKFIVGTRVGVLYAGGAVSIYTMHADEGFTPRLYAKVDLEFGDAPVYVGVNLYGKVEGVRLRNP